VESKRYDPTTAKTMVRYLDKYIKARIESLINVIRSFNGLSVGQAHHLNRALRAFINFLEILGFAKGWMNSLREATPKDQIGIDIKVPTRIGAKYYMALARQADQRYGEYADHVM
jgi:intergrase/recombinase